MSEGELMIDHRNSPGLSEGFARKLGLPPRELGAGGLFEAAMLRCNHCGVTQVKNPARTRERFSCADCGCGYICDNCKAASLQPEYVHRSFEQIAEMICSGRYTASGPTSAP